MQSFFHWFRSQGLVLAQPWLIFGKGPSFARRKEFDLSGYKTVALNHAVREQPVDVAHLIDLDVLHDCAREIEANARFVVMPWIPHVNCAVGDKTLGNLVRDDSALRRLSESGRLLWYNFGTAKSPNGEEPVVPAGWFSAEAVLNLLAMAGVRRVRSLGVDGGISYSSEFDDLADKTLLANGHESFDRQFANIARTIATTGIDFAPLDVESPVRVYVGSLQDQMLSVAVLDYSIRRHASMSVQLYPLWQAPLAIPTPRDPEKRPRTPFSFQRFLIPELAGYRGHAIYLDSDMLVLQDIRGLWTQTFSDADLLAACSKPGSTDRRPQFSVMLMDCEALRWDIRKIVEALDTGTLTYEQLMFEMAIAKRARADISHHWNSLERFEPGRTALLHYTEMPTQPWVSCENPLGELWIAYLFAALDDRFIALDFVKEHVERGWVRPSLLYQIEHRIGDASKLPPEARAMDDSFLAPFRSMRPETAASPTNGMDASKGSILARAGKNIRSMFGRS